MSLLIDMSVIPTGEVLRVQLLRECTERCLQKSRKRTARSKKGRVRREQDPPRPWPLRLDDTVTFPAAVAAEDVGKAIDFEAAVSANVVAQMLIDGRPCTPTSWTQKWQAYGFNV
eukprot:6121297-Amphidinium_carterae.1